MNFSHWLVIISIFISLGWAFAYIRDTLAGKTKPNRISWWMWALAPLIATAAAIYSHADIWATIRVFLAWFVPLLVVIASFVNKQSYWKLTIFDGICWAFSILALIIWAMIDAPKVAILLTIIGDAFAALPTLYKAWKYPETETWLTYGLSLLSVIIITPSIPVWNIENSGFQIYLLIVNTLLLVAVYRKRIFILAKYRK